MKVKELIEKLSQIDPEQEVLLPGYEGGYTNVSGVTKDTNVAMNVNTEWYYGDHELCDSPDKYPGFEKAVCTIIG